MSMPHGRQDTTEMHKKELLSRCPSESLNLDWLTRTRSKTKPPEDYVREHSVGISEEQEAALHKSTPSPSTGFENDHYVQDAHTTVLGSNRVVRERRRSISIQDKQNDWQYDKFNPYNSGVSLRRTKSLSMNSKGHIEEPKKEKRGFFRSLFGKKKKDSQPEKESESGGISSKESSRRNSVVDSNTATNSVTNVNSVRPVASASVSSKSEGVPVKTALPEDENSLKRSKTAPVMGDAFDSRLEAYLEYYKTREIPKLKEQGDESTGAKFQSRIPRSRPSFSIDANMDSPPMPEKKVVLDFKGRPIPPHPNKPKLPPAIKHCKEVEDSVKLTKTRSNSSSTANKFGAFLRRVTSHTEEHSSRSSVLDADDHSSDEESSEGSKETLKYSPAKDIIPGLEDMKPLKRVAFATNTYFNDPPQQICSRNPRKGEVEVKPDGSVVIHRLSPEEKREILQNASTGIVVGGSGHLKLLSSDDENETDAKRKEEMAPPIKPSSTKEDAVIENDEDKTRQRRNIGVAAAEAAAEARAKEAPNELQRTVTNNEEEVIVSKSASKVTIDKPMITRRSASSLASMMTNESDDINDIYPPSRVKIPHDVVYTRCCHLREILPIPATLKQLKKGSIDPIPLLQLRNPKPSLVEVLSFSDFLSISPVLCLSLDGVHLSAHMFRTILSSLMFKQKFEKLSLRNTPLDADGWKILCYFVSKCKSLNSLDLTMVPGLSLNVQKPSKSSMKSKVIRMTCNMDGRSDMNWNLLSAALVSNGGLEEMILSGAKMPLPEFKNFIELACISTERLGLAYNEITAEQCDVLADWLVKSKVTGLDIGFNDLNGKIKPFLDALMNKTKRTKNVFKYISLNCTNLKVPKGSTAENNEVLGLLSALCYCESLKFLDISNNPDVFPYAMPYLTDCLPVFVNLVRLHMDYDNLSPTSVVTLAEVLPMCKKLSYVSLLGTKLDFASSSALCSAVRKSSTILTLDLDYEDVPEKIKDKISLYTMRNMEAEINKVDNSGKKHTSGNFSSLQEELADLLTDKPAKREDFDVVVRNFVNRLNVARSVINKATEDLFRLRMRGELSTEGKETLIRFCFIDASFERGLQLLAQRYNSAIREPLDTSCDFDVSKNRFTEATPGKPLNPGTASSGGLKRTSSSATLSSTQFKESGHAALLPFNQVAVQSFDPADDAIEIKDGGNGGISEAYHQLREEGKVLKNTQSFIDQLKDNAQLNGQVLSPESLRKAAATFDSEEIKKFILSNDISSVADVLKDLQKHGVEINDLFKKRHENDQEKIGTIPNPGNTVVGVDANLMDSRQNKRDSYSSDSESEEEHEEEAIDRVYDEVLDNIERVRTNNQ